MAVFRPFRAVRPTKDMASRVAALPYDVMSSEEARKLVQGNPFSFLHVDKAEIDLDPSVGIYDARVYEKAAANLKKLSDEGVMVTEPAPVYYIYRLEMNGRSQAGIVGCASIDDYINNIIKKHELTRADKEEDRIRHVDICNANTGPIFLTFRSDGSLESLMCRVMDTREPLFDFMAEDGVRHTVYRLDDEKIIREIGALTDKVPSFYIADGHHRAASAVHVGQMRRTAHPDFRGDEEFNFFLSVLFPSEELKILDYNRVVRDLAGLSKEEFLSALKDKFEVSCAFSLAEQAKTDENALTSFRPERKHEFGMYLDGQWYRLKAKEGSFDASDPVKGLDVSILQDNLLAPVLKIGDPRTDDRISFIGGIRGLAELVKLVDSGAAAAFAMHPTSLDDLMEIADAGKIMPPKSTWFEPKLRSGLFIHEFDAGQE